MNRAMKAFIWEPHLRTGKGGTLVEVENQGNGRSVEVLENVPRATWRGGGIQKGRRLRLDHRADRVRTMRLEGRQFGVDRAFGLDFNAVIYATWKEHRENEREMLVALEGVHQAGGMR